MLALDNILFSIYTSNNFPTSNASGCSRTKQARHLVAVRMDSLVALSQCDVTLPSFNDVRLSSGPPCDPWGHYRSDRSASPRRLKPPPASPAFSCRRRPRASPWRPSSSCMTPRRPMTSYPMTSCLPYGPLSSPSSSSGRATARRRGRRGTVLGCGLSPCWRSAVGCVSSPGWRASEASYSPSCCRSAGRGQWYGSGHCPTPRGLQLASSCPRWKGAILEASTEIATF